MIHFLDFRIFWIFWISGFFRILFFLFQFLFEKDKFFNFIFCKIFICYFHFLFLFFYFSAKFRAKKIVPILKIPKVNELEAPFSYYSRNCYLVPGVQIVRTSYLRLKTTREGREQNCSHFMKSKMSRGLIQRGHES